MCRRHEKGLQNHVKHKVLKTLSLCSLTKKKKKKRFFKERKKHKQTKKKRNKDVHILIPRTWQYVMVHGKEGIKIGDRIEINNQFVLQQDDYLGYVDVPVTLTRALKSDRRRHKKENQKNASVRKT